MGFPFSITFFCKTNEFTLPNNVLEAMENDLKKRNTKNFNRTETELNLTSYESLVGFSYKVNISLYSSEKQKIKVKFYLSELLKIVVLIILFTAFFSTFSVSGFLWFSAILSAIFYFANLFYIKITLSRVINRFLKNYKNTAIELNEYHSENNCPACNESLNLYDLFCPECGLIQKQNNLSKNTDITKYMNTTIKYSYPKKKRLQ